MSITCIRTKHDPKKNYEQFKQDRLDGFGSSDMGSVMGVGDYSCTRRLFLERLNLLPETNDDKRKKHLERGQFFEAPVADLYASITGREVSKVGMAYLKEFPFIRANADRMVYGENGVKQGPGVLEIKCPSAWSFRKIKKEGLPPEYILQIQYQMLCYGVSWGSFAIYWPDGHELIHFDVERNEEIIKHLFETAHKRWAQFTGLGIESAMGTLDPSTLPEIQSPSSAACRNCVAFYMCHKEEKPLPTDEVMAPELEALASEYVSLGNSIKELEKSRDAIKTDLENATYSKGAKKLYCGEFTVTITEQSRETISTKVKDELTPEQLAKYVSKSAFTVMRVTQKKETKK